MFEILHRRTGVTGITRLAQQWKEKRLNDPQHISSPVERPTASNFQLIHSQKEESITNYRKVNVTANGNCRTVNSFVKRFSFKLFTKI